MNFSEYQKQAIKTSQTPDLIVPLLGLAGETGELLTEYKKYLRDGEAHKLFTERIQEELGDLLWYIADVASKFDLDLGKIAETNLHKSQDRWGARETTNDGYRESENYFDRNFPENERLPRQFTVEITEFSQSDLVKMKAFVNGQQIGNDLTDNSYLSDGYRFHDIFHFSYAAILGWSPVTRSNLRCKRKSHPLIDQVEDGGRATAIEEGISALVFSYAKNHTFLEGISTIDYQLLKTIKNMTTHLEVSKKSLGDWEKAIIMGYEVWRQVQKNRGGMVIVDLDRHSIIYQSL